jgi:hypothetical protein
VRSCDDSKADCEAAAEERHGGPRTRMEVGDHCERAVSLLCLSCSRNAIDLIARVLSCPA